MRQKLIAFENRMARKFDDGHMPYLVHFSGGNEDHLIEIFKEIKKGDYVFSTHRSHYHYLLAGGSEDRLENLITNGKSMFVFDRDLNFYSSSIVCATAAIAAGVAWALKSKGSSQRVWCFLGDGAEDEGHLCEAARYVDGWNLPCTFIIEDNDRSVSASKSERWGSYKGLSYDCIQRYSYVPTYPHGGTGTPGWLKFKCKPEIETEFYRASPIFSGPESKDGYMDAVKESMALLAFHGVIFIGYNVRHGSAYGSLIDIHDQQKVETPLAENLMAGLAMGMSLEGFRPVLYLERQDFFFNALDAIVNQMDKIEVVSRGEFSLPVIIKAVAGSIGPFYAGATHTSNYASALTGLLRMPILQPRNAEDVLYSYRYALESDGPVIVSEMKELY